MPWCNADTSQQYLNSFARQNEDEYKIIVLDNGAFHKAKKLTLPENIGLLFLPAYSPELNPAEKVWHHIKRIFTNKHFDSLSQISDFFTSTLKMMTKESILSICSYQYIFSGSFWSV